MTKPQPVPDGYATVTPRVVTAASRLRIAYEHGPHHAAAPGRRHRVLPRAGAAGPHHRAAAPPTGDADRGGQLHRRPAALVGAGALAHLLVHAPPTRLSITRDDALLRRHILTEAWSRPRDPGAELLTAAEREIIQRISATWPTWDGPVPMLAVAQLRTADIPDLPHPDGSDLLQVLWCPFYHEEDGLLRTVLRWRAATDVGDPLDAAPPPAVIGNDSFLPAPCELHPETVTEYPAPHELPGDLVERIHSWEQDHDLVYQYDLGVAPGCKVGGYAPWSFSDPFPMHCGECGADVRPLLTIDSCEWDNGGRSWRPIEDAGLDSGGPFPDPACPTMLDIGGHSLQLYTCAASYAHPHLQNWQ